MRYVVFNTAAQINVAEYEADAPLLPHQVDPAYAGFDFVTKDQDDNIVNIGQATFVWPAWEFKRKFTRDERIAVRELAKTDAVAADLLDILDSAPEIRSDDPDIVSAMLHLEEAGTIQSGRVAQIMNGA